MPNNRSKCAGTFSVVLLPFRCQKSVLRLSVLLNTVRSLTSKHWAIASRWSKPPASSKSEFETVPLGFSMVTSWSIMCCGHLSLHRTGWDLYPSLGTRCLAGNHTPPAPLPDASWWPSAAASSGTSSAMRVGRRFKSFNIHRKSARASCTPLLNVTLVLSLFESACCMWLNRCLAPGRASAIDRSSPSTLCHFFTLVRFCVMGILDKISARRSARCCGK
jgi:hypothetical protein|mmetsp:Transcript_3118/g.6462  ORF Transcript_3118/g.6462 Transcript_3118/m.6462 type:complete len:219 (-) Transcript_3118:5754-6410(-)